MGCTCILNANTVHGLITVSGLPFSIHIHIDTRSVPAWFIFTPPSKAHVPAINQSEIPIGLKAKIDHIAFSFIIQQENMQSL